MTQTLPRLIVELQSDGSYAIEYYLNGARKRQHVASGLLQFEIDQAMALLGADIIASAQRKEEAEARRSEQKKRDLWRGIYADHQDARFADKIVGKKYRPHARSATSPASVQSDQELLVANKGLVLTGDML